MYIFRSDNRLEVPIKLHLFKGMAEEVALIDSSATENFIDQETIKKLKLGTRKLEEPVWLRNIDGTYNQSGSVKSFINLLISCGGRKVTQRFYITNLGLDKMILGYPWLRAFNPEINWPNCKLIGPTIKMETLLHARNPRLREMLANKWGVLNSIIPTQEKADQVNLVVRHTEIAKTLNNRHMEIVETPNNGQTEEDLIVHEAIEAVIIKTLSVEANSSYGETVMEAKRSVMNELSPVPQLDEPEPEESLKNYVLEHYYGYLDMFTEKEAIPLPPHRPWDHVVTLIPDAPPSISCRVYPLSCGEEKFQAKYIKEQEDAGLIWKSKSPYSTPVFYIRKKNGSYHPIFNYRKINAITVKDVFPLPHIDTIIEGMREMVLFSKFDLCNGYWNIRNSKETEDLMAFKTTRGLYAPRVMSFGPTNAPACMQCFINHIFQPLQDRYPGWFENYMDDCSIATREGEQELHRQITQEFFDILRENHLFL
jgi:hypothetical protein